MWPTPTAAHVADCPQCLSEVAGMRRTPRSSTRRSRRRRCRSRRRAGWQRLSTAAPADGVRTVPRRPPLRAGPARACCADRSSPSSSSAPSLAGAGTAAANDWLQIFRTEQIAPLSLSAADLIALPDLSAYGDVEVTGDADVHEVADARPPRRDRPRRAGGDRPALGVSGEPSTRWAAR